MVPIPHETRKALLVGINYDSEDGEKGGALEGSHHNVKVLKCLLIEVYGYKPEDIVCLIDNPAVQNPDFRPTYNNIVRAIDNLVKDAKKGDYFFFYYSGHSGQVTNRNNSEEDGKDEVIVTSDNLALIDNELRQHLVEPLPIGSNLVALLDTCHSGSLLDLEHWRCNRVYTPHISKGCRRTDSRLNRNVRHLAMEIDLETQPHIGLTGFTFVAQEPVIIRAWSSDSPGPSPQPPTHPLPTESRPSLPSKIDADIPIPVPFLPFMPRCDSPTPFWCDGHCRDKGHIMEAETANVVCISACKDDQVTWEGPDGLSLALLVVSILKEEPYPRLDYLMKRLNSRVHEQARMLHEETVKYKKARKAYRHGRPTSTRSRENEGCGETDNFWDPQMASLKPLDMSSRLPL